MNSVTSRLTLIAVWAILFCYSCDAHYQPTLTRFDPIGANSRKATAGDLVFYVEEYASVEKAERAFATDMVKEGILPILVLTRNTGTKKYQIDQGDFTLHAADRIQHATAADAAKKAEREYLKPAIGWSLVVPIITIPVAIALSAHDTHTGNQKIREDFQKKAFRGGTLESGKELSGFLFFKVEPELARIPAMMLEVNTKSLDNGEPIHVSIQLPETLITAR